MFLKFGLFFSVNDIDSFCKHDLFDLSKYTNLDICFCHEIISKDEMKQFNIGPGLKFYDGYLFRQKDSFIIYVNNLLDNWITNIEFTCAKYGYKGLYVFVDTENVYPAYELYYFDGNKKRIIYSIKDGDRWCFYKQGEPQFFEMDDSYDERGAVKKFNYQKLKSFCKNLGINLEDDNFLIPVGNVYHTYAKN